MRYISVGLYASSVSDTSYINKIGCISVCQFKQYFYLKLTEHGFSCYLSLLSSVLYYFFVTNWNASVYICFAVSIANISLPLLSV
jgi:hypothetical protein